MKQNLFLADLHTHLLEKKMKPKDYWVQAQKQKLSVVAITEHVEYDPKIAYKKLKATQPKGIILIPGMEAKTSAGHLVILGKDESIYNVPKIQKINIPIEEALREIKKHKLTASFAHPYGYKTDSTCIILGEKQTKKLLKKYGTGIEYYNGMLGSANGLVFGSKWVNRFYTIFNFLDKNRLTRALTLKSSTKIRTQLEQIAQETLDRVRKAIIFAENAKFITVGSDAHYAHTIGSSVINMKRKPQNEKDFLEQLEKKEITYAGPNIYSEKPIDHLKRKELLEGIKYMTKHKIIEKITIKKFKKTVTKKIIKKVKPKISGKTIKRIAKNIKKRVLER